MRPLEHSQVHPTPVEPQMIYVESEKKIYCCGLGNFVIRVVDFSIMISMAVIGFALSPILFSAIWINEKIEKWKHSEEG
jgi:hypothetical protein